MFLRTSRIKWPARLIVAGIILALAMLAGVTLMAHFAFQKAEFELAVERNRQLTFLSAFRLKSELTRYSEVLQDLAKTKEIQSFASRLPRSALQQASFRLADFDGGVVLLDNFGRVITSEPERFDILEQDWSNRQFFRQLISTNSIVFSNIVNDGPGGEPVVVICVPVLDENGQFNGALAGMFRLGQQSVSPFYASIVRLRLGETGKNLLVDGNGYVLFDSASNLVGERYSGWAISVPVGEISGAVRTVDSEGRDTVVSYALIPGTPWTLVTDEDWQTLVGPVQKYINLLFSLMILGISIPSAGLGFLLHLNYKMIGGHAQLLDEMHLARQIKHNLLPKQVPVLSRWTLKAYYKPAARVSGDYYDLMYLPDGRFMLAVCEVTGNGLPAMLALTPLRMALRGAGQRLLSPEEVLDCSNTLICPEVRPYQSINCVYAVLDPDRDTLEFSCAGEIIFYRIKERETVDVRVSGPPLGVALNSIYQQSRLQISPGEKILFCSHDVISVSSPKGDLFGLDRLKMVLSDPADNELPVLDRVVSELRKFSGKNWDTEEDITLLLLERDTEG